jgi:hypothetical protein
MKGEEDTDTYRVYLDRTDDQYFCCGLAVARKLVERILSDKEFHPAYERRPWDWCDEYTALGRETGVIYIEKIVMVTSETVEHWEQTHGYSR